MHTIFLLLAAVAGIASFVCWLIILIDAFKASVVKGLIGFFCGLYLLYYAIVEFQHENKLLIVMVGFLGGAISAILSRM